MTEPHISFKCLGRTTKADGSTDRFIIEVTDSRDGEAEELHVEAGHLLSAQSMKRILLGQKVFYSVTQNEHTKIVNEMFDAWIEATKR